MIVPETESPEKFLSYFGSMIIMTGIGIMSTGDKLIGIFTALSGSIILLIGVTRWSRTKRTK